MSEWKAEDNSIHEAVPFHIPHGTSFPSSGLDIYLETTEHLKSKSAFPGFINVHSITIPGTFLPTPHPN